MPLITPTLPINQMIVAFIHVALIFDALNYLKTN